MAIQTSALFTGFRGSVNKKILFRQCGGKTVMSRFPNRSRVIYSEHQKQVQKRFSDAVDFARVVIKEPGLKDIYSVKAALLGFRSAWNLAIAEFMSETPLVIKRKKIRFDKSILRRSLRWNIPVKLYKFAEEPEHGVLKVPRRLRSKPARDRAQAAGGQTSCLLSRAAVYPQILFLRKRDFRECPLPPCSGMKWRIKWVTALCEVADQVQCN